METCYWPEWFWMFIAISNLFLGLILGNWIAKRKDKMK